MAAVHVLRRRAAARGLRRASSRGSGWPEFSYALLVVGDPRAGAHAASDTRTDTQIPQSLTLARSTFEAFTSPNIEGRPGASLPPYRTPPRGRGRRRDHAGAAARSAFPWPTPTTSRTGSKRVENKIEHADDDAGALQRRGCAGRTARSSAAQAELDAARAAAGRGRWPGSARPASATRRCSAKLEHRPGPARAGAGRARRRAAPTSPTQREAVTDMVTSIYQDGDPQLQAFSSMLQRRGPRRPDLDPGGPAASMVGRRPGPTTSCGPPRSCSRSARTRSPRPRAQVEVPA